MSWKICLTAFVSLLLTSIPQNMIGCGPDQDPHDYFTSFFSHNTSGAKGYQPFYYTSLLDFYDDWMDTDEHDADDKIINEWQQYGKQNFSAKETKEFIYTFKKEVTDQLIKHLSNKTALGLPDSVKANALVKFFLAQKDLAALGYLSFAKDVERFTWSADWETPAQRDSLVLNQYIKEAEQKYNEEKNVFLKEKYAFQKCKLAFYNNRFADCIRWYDEHFALTSTSAVQQLALAYKGGSLFRSGKNKEAAYIFSKAFAQTGREKKKIFLGFLWATSYCNNTLEDEYIALAKNNTEKAAMLGMFGLYGIDFRLATMQKVYALDPAASLLPVLAVREINKIEEQIFTPALEKEKGGKAFYLSWSEDSVHSNTQLIQTISFFEKLAADKNIVQPALYVVGSAYLHFINKNYKAARAYLAKAKSMSLSNELNDQWQLINLLVMANEKPALDAAGEKAILASVQWLTKKAKSDQDYLIFFRNLFSQIIAQKYEQQKDAYRAALAYGVADAAFIQPSDAYYQYGNGIEYVRNEMNTEQLLKLHQLFTKPATEYETYLLQHSSFNRDGVIDVIGTSYLRDFNFKDAIEWLKKSGKPEPLTAAKYNYTTGEEATVNVDPLHDYLNDWQRFGKAVAKPYTKLSLAQKLLELQQKADTAKSEEEKSKMLYQLGSAFYNMSYYGNSWNAVAYNRSGNEWNNGNYDAEWKKEYYGVYKSKEYYQRAHDLTKNREFKAACYFMVAKCLQRQIKAPDYTAMPWEQYEKEQALFEKKFRNNPMFEGFIKQYGNTKFYSYTFNRCSYLSDFVKSLKTK